MIMSKADDSTTPIRPPIDDSDERFAEHFRDLESPMCEIYCMAKITADVATKITRSPQNEIVHFAIARLCEMVCELHADYATNLGNPAVPGEAVQS
jgi:hypothetical protein